MAKSKLLQPLPWYRWNPSKWQGSRKVQRMDWAAKGLYRELMDECWIKGSIPSTVAGIAGLFDVEESEIASLVSQVIRCFVVTDETMISPFIEEVRTEMDDMRVTNSLNARKRWDKVREDGNADSCDGIDNDAMASKTMREEKRREEKRKEEENIVANATTVVAEAVTATDSANGKQTGKDEPKAKRTRRNRDEILVPYGENVRKVVNSVLSPGFWPKSDPDGRVITPDPSLLCANVALIFTDHPTATPELLIQAAKCYTAKDKTRFCAPQFFFGKGKVGGDAPHWIAEYRMAVHQAQRKTEMEAERLLEVAS